MMSSTIHSIPKHNEREREKAIDIDSICSELYKCSNNREMFNAVMNDLKEEVLGEDCVIANANRPQIHIKSLKEFLQYNNNRSPLPDSNSNPCHNPYGNNNQPPSQMMPSNNEYYNYKFVSSVPEGEMVNMKPFKNKTLYKNYTDVHANSKYYYSNQFQEGNEFVSDSQWTNKTNNIMLNSQGNNNWLDLRTNDNMINQPHYDNYTDDKRRFNPM